MKLNILILPALIAVVSDNSVAWVAEPRDEEWWYQRHGEFINNTLNNPSSIRILFYGDSITEGWLGNGLDIFNEYYAPLGTANYGIGGDRTENVLYRIKDREVTNMLNPALCVLKIGTNNIWNTEDLGTALGITYIVMELRERLPNMKILLLGVLPRSDEGWTERTRNINEMIRHMDNGDTIRYLDMKDHFYRGGNDFVSELYESDLVHLKAAGYRKWAEVMHPLFMEMLNSTRIK